MMKTPYLAWESITERFKGWNIGEASHEKKKKLLRSIESWLFRLYKGIIHDYYTTQLYGDDFINHETRKP